MKPSKPYGVRATSKEIARHNAQVAAQEADYKHGIAAKAKKAGLRKVKVRADDGTVQEVWQAPASFERMGFQAHQIVAAERFNTDWQIAYAPLKGQGYEPSVDGGRAPDGPHRARVAAVQRLHQCRSYLRDRDWEIVVAVVVNGATSVGIERISGVNRRTAKSHMDAAFDNLDNFYNRGNRRDRTWIAFSRFNQTKEPV